MSRSHTIEETIEDTLPLRFLLATLKENGLIPKEWEFCSIHVTQTTAGDEIKFVSKRSYAAPKSKG